MGLLGDACAHPDGIGKEWIRMRLCFSHLDPSSFEAAHYFYGEFAGAVLRVTYEKLGTYKEIHVG